MSAVKKSLVSGLAVAASALAVVFGSQIRNRVDEGGPLYVQYAPPANTSGLVVSTDEIAEGDYFRDMVRLLKREFVEPIKEDQELALGGVKGMISSLGDARSQYYDPDGFKAFLNAQDGEYEGIGAAFLFETPYAPKSGEVKLNPEDGTGPGASFIPYLKVAAVTPGGPAEEAGLKPGDVILEIDEKWLPDPSKVARMSALLNRISASDFKSLAPEKAEKLQLEYRTLGGQLKPLVERMITPGKARDNLALGSAGSVKLVWRRKGERFEKTLQKEPSSMGGVKVEEDGTIVLPIRNESLTDLKAAITGKTDLTIDLRNNPMGEYEAIRPLLSLLAPAGRYGTIDSQREGKDVPFELKEGNSKPPKITLLVDGTTRGAAEIFALALSSKGVAKLSGSKMAGDLAFVETVTLPDGSGYTLVTGMYTTENKTEDKKPQKSARNYETKPIRRPSGQRIALMESNGGNA
jgi:carboxyl-terminal processing protease